MESTFSPLEASNPLPSIFPTLAPSVAPTESPFPTPDPETAPCMLESKIRCTRDTGGSCNDLASPAGTTCIGSNADRLQFVYLPAFCDGNNTQDRFRCEDDNENIARPNSAHISISRRDAIFFSGVVSTCQIFSAMFADEPNEVDILISTVAASGNGPELLLQESRLSIRCRADDGPTLLDTFGALQLVGFRNAELGSQQIFERLEISYTVRNEGRLDADLTGAARSNDFNGFGDLLWREWRQ